MFTKKTVRDINLKDKRVLLRVDYNVPLKDGKITDDYRVQQSLPTIKYILENKPACLIIISHAGRPKNRDDLALSLEPVAKRLGELLNRSVEFTGDCINDNAKEAVDNLRPGGILLMQNLRFYPEEKKNDSAFAEKIVEASRAEVFVQDGFGVVHRAHASTEAITKFLPSVAGLLLEKEVDTITTVMKEPKRPLTAVVGGAKIPDKAELLDTFIEMADCVAIGGALANTFLVAEGFKVGKSIVDKEAIGLAKKVIARARETEKKRNFNFLLPVDVVVSTKIDGTAPTRIVDLTSHSISDIEAYPKTPKTAAYTVGAEEMILDIGPLSAENIAGAIQMSKTVIWNGTMGVTETKGLAGTEAPFSHGTRIVADAMVGTSNQHANTPFSVVGGGDTVGYVKSAKMLDDFNHVSTGGGASLELMAGHKLPGVESLLDK